MKQNYTIGRMLRPIRRLWLCITFVVLMASGGYGQLDTYLNNMEQGYDFYDIRSGMNHYLDSLRTTMDSAIFFAGDSEYKRFKLFESVWEPRLSSHGDFSMYYDAMADYYNNKRIDYTYYSTEMWHDLGPKTTYSGIGPVEFVTFYDNGTADSTFIMLTGSTVGGLFYSTDTGNIWQPTGTDDWPQSGCSWAVFHPNNHRIWYAASSGNSASTEAMWIGKLGGIQRTTDEGKTWHTIADYNDFGKWTKIYQIALHPADPTIMYASTSAGLWKTDACNISEPTWTKVLDGFIYDLEFRPDIDSVMYAAIYDKVAKQWKIMISENNGDILTWEAPPSQPEYLNDEWLRKQHFTIEVSKARPGYLFCFTRDTSYHSLYYVNMDSTFSWQHIVTFNDGHGYGDGHGFGVEQTGSGDTIFVSYGQHANKYNIFNGGKKVCSMVHADVEDLVYHPYLDGEVWACTHGGVEKLIAYGTKFSHKYNGLGVGQIEGFATAYSEPQPILSGLYHDGNQMTTAHYQPGWKTDWKQLLMCDGMKPVIDNTDADHMFISGQWGDWLYTTDAFQTSDRIDNNADFLGIGVLNKHNPNVFFMNNYDPEPFENVKRKCWDHSSIDGTISNFQSMVESPVKIITFGFYTPYTDADLLIANMIFTQGDSLSGFYSTFRLMRTKNANRVNPQQVLWHELTIPTNKKSIAGIAFNPDEADKIILAYTTQAIQSVSDSMIFKIDYTNPASPIIDPITYNLPITSINKNCIAVDKHSNGGIYIATEYGVFYTDNLLMENPENAWQLIGIGLPHVRPTGIEISFHSRTIRVATFGRGVWELNLPCITNSSPIVISTDTIWNTKIPLQCGIVVAPGATLTIAAGGEVYFPPSAKVVVKPGARLVLDSCLLTRRCADRWQGIEVWGNEELGQSPSSNQGVLVMKNGATISYALTGALAGHNTMAAPDGGSTPPEDRKGGGIIVATDARFENNITGVSFVPYTQHNTSRFLKCTFLNDNLLTPDETFRMALLEKVKHVRFAGCDFINNTKAGSIGIGIRSYDAQYYVNRYCNALYGDDCINWKIGTFEKLEYGIYALATTPLTHVAIDNTSFIRNKRGIYLSGMSLAEVTSNTINSIGDYGLYLDGCTGYHVEDNYFISEQAETDFAGIVVNNSGNDPNEIYRNTFEEVNYGILAQGHNRSLRTGKGLECKCNNFSLGEYDIVVTATEGSTNFGIARYQGSSAPQPDAPAGNRFSWRGPEGIFTDINNLGFHFTYFYHVNQSEPLEPIYYDPLKVTAVPNYDALWDSTSCVSSLNPPGSVGVIEQNIRSFLAASEQQADSVSQLLQALEDAGNTESLQWDVDMSLPEQSYEIYSELLNTSPYVSDTVMATAISKEEVLPDAMIRDVMVANPEAAKNDALIEKLQERTNPMPEYMLGQILQGRSLISVYGDLMAAQDFYTNRMAFATRVLKHIYASDTLSPAATDSLMALLQNEKTLDAQVHLAFCYLQQTDTAAALSVLASIRQQYPMGEQQLAEHSLLTDYMNLLTAMPQGVPDSTQAAWLMDATLYGTGPASTFARNLLLAMELIDYNEPVLFPDATKSVAIRQYPYGGALAEASDQLEVYPNPAADHLIIKWTLEEPAASGTAQIAGLDGRVVSQFALDGSVGQKVISTGGLKPGVYVVTVFVDNQQVAAKKLSIYR